MTFVRTRLALDRMAPRQILLVRLRGEEQLSFVEIAQCLNKPTADAARKQFDRALKKLEQILGHRL